MKLSSWWVAGLTAALVAVAAAISYLAFNSWFGVGDLPAMVMWSLPLGVLLALAVRVLEGRLVSASAIWRYLVLVPVGGIVGFLWTVLAAALLGGWIGAFSFPVLFCWVAGGLLGGIVAASHGHPATWPIAALLAIITVVGLESMNAYARAPEPRIRVVVSPDASPEEVQRVWTEVLGRPSTRPGEHYMLPGIRSVAATGREGASQVLTVAFDKRTTWKERDSLMTMILRSPLVARIDTVPKSDRSGVRTSVSY